MAGWAVTAGLTVLVVVIAGFLIERAITTAAFDRLEAGQVAQDAQRLRIALDAEVRLLTNYGTTNSIWDDSYASVRDGDGDAFAAAFPPADVHRLYGLDGVLGVGPDGTLRAGGLAAGTAGFTTPPADLARPEVLKRLFEPGAAPGKATCGVVTSSAAPYLFCGLAAYDSNSQGPSPGGLVYLKALDTAGVTALGRQVDLPVTVVATVPSGSQHQPAVTSSLGALTVSTATLSGNRMVLDAAIPTVDSGAVILQAARTRPIHGMASSTAFATLLLMLATGVLLLVVVMILVARGIRQQVRPLRRTADAVIASGDRSLRVGHTGTGEIAALGMAIDRMLDALAAKGTEFEREHAAREQEMRLAIERQREAEERALAHARSVLDDTSALVVGPLAGVAVQVDAVRGAADDIDSQVESTRQVTANVVGQAGAADGVVAGLGDSLRQVDGIAQLIMGLAKQTNLLALNATIEAARAGAAGAGFHVVATEVKMLATSTAESTHEITGAVAALQESATAVAGAIAAMTEGIAGIEAATTAIGQAADRQRSTMAELDAQVGQALTRAREMAEH
jgi:methyl-accepting chemotaxis protein